MRRPAGLALPSRPGRAAGCLLAAALAASAPALPYRASPRWHHSALHIAPADLNGDSTDDLLVLEHGQLAQVRDLDLTVVSGSRFLDRGTLQPGSEAGGFSLQNLWATTKLNDTLYLLRLWPFRRFAVATGKDIAPPAGWDGGLWHVGLADLDGDGALEAFGALVVGFDLRPRGIIVLDWETGREKWRFLTGPNIYRLLLRDVDGDGRLELLCAAYATGNGGVASGMTDRLTYLLLLDASGNLRWVRQVGCYSSALTLGWLNPADSADCRVLVTELGSPVSDRQQDSVFVFDARSGEVLARAGYGGFNRQATVFEDRGGHRRILLAGTGDTLRLLDESLRVVRQRSAPGAAEFLQARAMHLPGRGERVVPVQTVTRRLVLYDSRLNRVAELDLPERPRALPVRAAGGDMLLVESAGRSAYLYSLYEFRPVPFWERPVPAGWLAGLAALAVALLVGLAYWSGYHRARDIRAVIRGLSGQAGVVELDRSGRVLRSNQRAWELLPELRDGILPAEAVLNELIQAATLDPPGSAPREGLLAHSRRLLCRATRVRTGVLLTVEDLAAEEFARRARQWLPVAQRLAHGIKNPLTTVTLTAQRLGKTAGDDQSRRYAGDIEREAERLRRMTDNFMRFTRFEPPELKPTDLNQVVQNCVDRFGNAERVDLALDLAPEPVMVLAAEEQLCVVVDNLTENAIAAMPEGGRLSIRTRVVMAEAGQRKAELTVRDTGCGIPAQYLEKVFEPYFTLKEGGTGLGMVIARKIVEDHGGSIRLESTEGEGTVAMVNLPMMDPRHR
ncbi:MAG: ATP-binding protein [bacterium]